MNPFLTLDDIRAHLAACRIDLSKVVSESELQFNDFSPVPVPVTAEIIDVEENQAGTPVQFVLRVDFAVKPGTKVALNLGTDDDPEQGEMSALAAGFTADIPVYDEVSPRSGTFLLPLRD